MRSDIRKPNNRNKIPTKSLNFPHTIKKGVSGVPKDTTDLEATHDCPDGMVFSNKAGKCINKKLDKKEKILPKGWS